MSEQRETAQIITDVLGIEDGGRATEAFTRFLNKGGRTGWNSLTQADFDAIQDACDDGMGRPRRKHDHPIAWKVKRWWHWHVVSPIVYPVLSAPGDAWHRILWHTWKKRHGGKVLYTYRGDDGEGHLGEQLWTERRDQTRELTANLPLRHRVAARLGRLHSAWIWECPSCDIFAEPEETGGSEAGATAGLDDHVQAAHAGSAPDECDVTQVFWI